MSIPILDADDRRRRNVKRADVLERRHRKVAAANKQEADRYNKARAAAHTGLIIPLMESLSRLKDGHVGNLADLDPLPGSDYVTVDIAEVEISEVDIFGVAGFGLAAQAARVALSAGGVGVLGATAVWGFALA